MTPATPTTTRPEEDPTMPPYEADDLAPDDEPYPRCPACGDPIDYCAGHGAIGDPAGAAILRRHDDGDHSTCDPEGCLEAAPPRS